MDPVATTDDVNYLGVDLGGLNATLVGLEAIVDFGAWDINVLVNKATDGAGLPTTKLDWKDFVVSSGIALPDFTSTTANIDLDENVDIHADGNVALNALSGVLVARAGFSLSLGTIAKNSFDVV